MTSRSSLLGRSAASLATIACENNYSHSITNGACLGAFTSLPSSIGPGSSTFEAPPRVARLYSLPLRYLSTSRRSVAMSAASENPVADLKEGGATELKMAVTSPIAESLAAVRKRVAEVTAEVEGRKEPRLVAVSKTKPIEDLKAAYAAGQRIFGENYAQELIEKSPQMPDDVVWHFIGHLQSNKAKGLVAGVPNLDVLETLDTSKLADKLQAACQAAERDRPLGVFIQIDTSGEDAKSGVSHSDLDACLSLARHIKDSCPLLALKGVMTIGAPGDMECFDRLSACRDALAEGIGVEAHALELSMGMSGDYEEAIRRGSTNVRVGSTIFGARYYPNKK